jgi:hypothetical protein
VPHNTHHTPGTEIKHRQYIYFILNQRTTSEKQQMELAKTSTKCNFKGPKFVGLFIVWKTDKKNDLNYGSITCVKEQPIQVFIFFIVVPCILILSKSFFFFFFIFTNGCTIYLLRSALKFTLKFTLKLLLHVSV